MKTPVWADVLREREYYYCEQICRELETVPSAQPLLKKIEKEGGLADAGRGLLFELRFAAELHRLGLEPDYEYKTGERGLSVDFKLEDSGATWLVELVRIDPSDAVRNATHFDPCPPEGIQLGITELSTDAQDDRQSGEGEIIRAQEKIAPKAEKFPTPAEKAYNVIMIDMRGFGVGMSDRFDYEIIAFGHANLPSHLKRYWRGNAIKGLFSGDNQHSYATNVQQKIHILGFVHEIKYEPWHLLRRTCYLGNPPLFNCDLGLAGTAYGRMPFRREAIPC